jgi:dipeptidyl aminopeptidase/acylaminoacyl peptidase
VNLTNKILMAALLVALSGVTAALPVLQPADVFGLQYVSNPIVDSQGKRILYLRNSMDIMKDRRRSNLWSINVDGEQHRPITSGAINVSSPALASDDNRVAWVAQDGTGAQIFMHWLDTGQTAQLSRLPSAPKNLSFSPDGQWLAFVMHVPASPPVMGKLIDKPKGAEWADPPIVIDSVSYRDDGRGNRPAGFDHVFLMRADGGSVRQLTSGDFRHGSGLSWNLESDAIYFSANRAADWEQNTNNSEIHRVEIRTGNISTLTDRQGHDFTPAVSPRNGRLAYRGFDDKKLGYQRRHLYVMNADGSGKQELLAEMDINIQNAQWSNDGKRIYFQYSKEGKTVLASTDMAGKFRQHADSLSGQAFSRPYSSASYAVGGNGVYAFTIGDTSAPAELAVGRGSARPVQLTHLNENLLGARDLASVEERWLKSSADGLDIQAWVAKPPGFDPAKKYPMILEIHGGPFADYGFHFSAEVQLFAAAGYVVVYANPRGSTGYGTEFANKIHHNYPSQDYDDLMSVVDTVIAEGYVDEDQLYVTGGSGGGTLTAWTVGKTDRFRAAVVAKPVINWTSFVLTADNAPFFTRYWFPAMPWEDPEGYWARSPLSLVGNVTTPTMLLTGEEDLRTPMAETEQYYQALKLQEVESAMVRIPGASHGIAARPSQLLAKVAAILAWFERYAEPATTGGAKR